MSFKLADSFCTIFYNVLYTFHFINASLDLFLEFELWNEIISAFE